MPTLTDLQAQYDRLQEAIAQTPPEHRAGLHYASGLLMSDIKAHPDYCPKCQGRGRYNGLLEETGTFTLMRCECRRVS